MKNIACIIGFIGIMIAGWDMNIQGLIGALMIGLSAALYFSWE